MTWETEYVVASFRGISFYTSAIRYGSGRRHAVHQYPYTDETEHEDLGLKDQQFNIDGIVIGNNYHIDRDALEKALTQEGPGRLLLPLRRPMLVSIGSFQVTETDRNGGMARFSITCMLEPDPLVSATADNKALLKTASENLNIAIGDWFEDVYDAASAGSVGIGSAQGFLDTAFSVMDSARSSAASAAAFKRKISDAKGRLIALSVHAAGIRTTFEDVINFGITEFNALVDLFSKKDVIREQRRIYSTAIDANILFDNAGADNTSPSRQINTLQLHNTVSAMAFLIADTTYNSIDGAEEEQALLFNAIDYLEQLPTITATVLAALRDCRAKAYLYIQEDNIKLPLITEYVPMQQTNTLALSYATYGNITEAASISDINNIVHPGFIPTIKPLRLRVYRE